MSVTRIELQKFRGDSSRAEQSFKSGDEQNFNFDDDKQTNMQNCMYVELARFAAKNAYRDHSSILVTNTKNFVWQYLKLGRELDNVTD